MFMGENKPTSVRPHTSGTSCLVRLEAEATKTFWTVKCFDHESGKIGRRPQLLLVKNVKHMVAIICLRQRDTVAVGTPKLVPVAVIAAVIVNFGNFKCAANLGHFESKLVPEGDQAEPKLRHRLLTNQPNQPGRSQ